MLAKKKVLVAGAGTTGSEMIKLLTMSEIDLTILDFDTVNVTDLNRQFYSREKDIGRKKVVVIQQYFKKMLKNVKIIDRNLFECEIGEFDVIFSCFDNFEARLELNYRISQFKNCILIDLGIEGNFAHVKKVIFGQTSCLYCIKDLFTQENVYNYCSLKGNMTREQKIYTLAQKHPEISRVIEIFNSENDKKTDKSEVIGIRDNIIPNTCYIASICASMAIHILENEKTDFIFYNGSKSPHFVSQVLEMNEDCFICSNIKRSQDKFD